MKAWELRSNTKQNVTSADYIRRVLRLVLWSTWFQILSGFCLGWALFASSWWVILDFEDAPGNAVLDALMVLVFLFFVTEILICSFADHRYPLSFFFWMDVMGSASMIFEISFLLGPAGKPVRNNSQVDTVVMRTARAAKVGARAGRLVKLTKLANIIIGRQSGLEEKGSAKALSRRILAAMSTRMSCLTIFLVLVLPFFTIVTYPEADNSMRGWLDRLEEAYADSIAEAVAGGAGGAFRRCVRRLVNFYEDGNYEPYRLHGFPEYYTLDNGTVLHIPGERELNDAVPRRLQNVFIQTLPEVLVRRRWDPQGNDVDLRFDFGPQNRLQAWLDMTLIVFVVIVMLASAFNLSRVITEVAIKPIDHLIMVVRTQAQKFLGQCKELGTVEEDDNEDDDKAAADETAMLERTFEKLTKLITTVMAENVVDDSEMKGMDNAQKGVLVDMLRLNADPARSTMASFEHGLQPVTKKIDGDPTDLVVTDMLVPLDLVESWELDVLSVAPEAREQVALYIMFDSQLGGLGTPLVSVEVYSKFYEEALGGYTDQPYHNAIHAVDVLHTVFRLLCETKADKWVSRVDTFALLVAALCHDLGHPGKTNPFLVETQHPWAINYNDSSPLENMHCASLFKICAKPELNVFRSLDQERYRKARKVCIATILHTDNAHHFEMVKDINKIYQLAEEACDLTALDTSRILEEYYNEVLLKHTQTLLQLFLHLADVSNPLKLFAICEAWADRVLEEFFAQGDEEKKLGVPVGMLNDRDKINRPGSQHGFINFLVAPLVFGSISVFPPLQPLGNRMATNLGEWRNLWVKDADPPAEDVAKRDADVVKVKERVEDLRARAFATAPAIRSSRATRRVHPRDSAGMK